MRHDPAKERFSATTIWQPWASLIAAGCKPFEFRCWAAPKRLVGQRIAIHAGARPVRKSEVRELLLRLHSSYWRETGLQREPSIKLLETVLNAPRSLPLSSVLCLALLGKPVRDNELAAAIGAPLVNDSDRDQHTNYGWPLSDIEVLEPFVPARGAQGWWLWTREKTDDLVAA